jgi:hypothetical protein
LASKNSKSDFIGVHRWEPKELELEGVASVVVGVIESAAEATAEALEQR